MRVTKWRLVHAKEHLTLLAGFMSELRNSIEKDLLSRKKMNWFVSRTSRKLLIL